ncbi:MAG: DUF4058 family protein [Planctomycetes bacterium]|nr:DUF4058 family protein [Planctomycetota bacterium]
MPSPFPGMDPYLEAPNIYPDFHQALAYEVRRALVPRLRPRYVARVYGRQVVDALDPDEVQIVHPDVAVAGLHRRGARPEPSSATASAAVALTPAVEVRLAIPVKARQFRVEVRLARLGDLVTAIELVSLSNKRPGSDDAEAYRRKREEYLGSSVHFIELDLLRALPRWSPEGAPQSEYRVLLHRATRPLRVSVWPVGLRDALPTLPVPLRAPDPDVPLELQPIFAAVYDAAGYDLDLDYSSPPPAPSLSAADARWLRGMLAKSAGR